MKSPTASSLAATTLLSLSLAGFATAFHGSLGASPYIRDPSGYYQYIYLEDYLTGSKWAARVDGGWDNCADGAFCWASFIEQTPGVYNYAAKIWRTDDGCHNIDFNGYLDAHHGYCCGSLPCDIWA
ncbi:hypothetical protein BJX65DRAFT_315413 [Aspergillus insuetus]